MILSKLQADCAYEWLLKNCSDEVLPFTMICDKAHLPRKILSSYKTPKEFRVAMGSLDFWTKSTMDTFEEMLTNQQFGMLSEEAKRCWNWLLKNQVGDVYPINGDKEKVEHVMDILYQFHELSPSKLAKDICQVDCWDNDTQRDLECKISGKYFDVDEQSNRTKKVIQ